MEDAAVGILHDHVTDTGMQYDVEPSTSSSVSTKTGPLMRLELAITLLSETSAPLNVMGQTVHLQIIVW